MQLAIVGIPGSGKTTLSSLISRRYEIEHLHVSHVLSRWLGDAWAPESGDMAPEPQATRIILVNIGLRMDERKSFVLDGFPRTQFQFDSLQRWIPIVFLTCVRRAALARLQERGRMDMKIEAHRIREQSRLLSPVRNLAACMIDTSYLTPTEVLTAFDQWWRTGVEKWRNY